MDNFIITNSIGEINIGKEWVNSANFKSKGTIVDDKGNIPSSNYTGQRYRLIAEKERHFSCFERLSRGLFGILLIVCSLGILLFSRFIKDLFTKKHESIRFGFFLDPFFSQPKEIHLKILSYLNSTDLGKCLAVSKKWQVLVNNETLWKALPLPIIAFGKNQWTTYFGNIGEAPPLPMDIHKTLKSRCPFWPDKKVEETHTLILIPETVNGIPLTLNTLGMLIKAPKAGRPAGYRSIDHGVINEYGNKSITKSHWILMTKDILPESRNKVYAAQKALVTKLVGKTKIAYEIPNLLDIIISLFMKYVSSKERLFNDRSSVETYTRCQENVRGYHIVVNGNPPASFCIYNNDSHANIGVAAQRKL